MSRCVHSKAIALMLVGVFIVSMIPVLAELDLSNSTQNISVSQSIANKSFSMPNSNLTSVVALPSQKDYSGYNFSNQVSSPEKLMDNNFSLYIWNWANIGEGPNDLEWQKCLGGSSDDRANSIQQTTDGGYIVAGYTYSNDGDVSGNSGLTDAWVTKLDSNKAIQWQECLGTAQDDYAKSIRQTSDGGYIVAGYSRATSWPYYITQVGRRSYLPVEMLSGERTFLILPERQIASNRHLTVDIL